MTSHIAFLSLLLGLLQAAAPAPKASVAPPMEAPATTYHNDALKLDYTYPTSFQNMTALTDEALKKKKESSTGALRMAVDCVTVPVTGLDMTKGFRMLFIMRLDEACLGEETSAAELGVTTTAILSKTLEQFGKPTLDPSADYDLETHKASAVSGTVAAEKLGTGKLLFTSAACSINGKNIVCWEFIADDCAARTVLSNYPVKFEGQPAQPVIPAKLIPVCR